MQKKNIIHRDIKPENILLTDTNIENADIKLADFGLSKSLLNTNMTNTHLGTPLYQAPEIGQQMYDYRIDIWSLGCTLFEMLTGYRPFKVTTLGELNLMQKMGVVYPDGLTICAKHLLSKMLARNPGERLSYDEIKLHPFVTHDLEKTMHMQSAVQMPQEERELCCT